jgi:lysophospholipase L1-like esterase
MPARSAYLVLLTLLAALLVACSGGGGAQGGGPDEASAAAPSPSAPSTPPPGVYVAVGASETVGVGAADPQRDAWPQVLHDSALPSSRLVNVGVSGATVRDALQGQLPRALAAEPDVATVWLAVNDLVTLEPVGTYETQLRDLVHALRRGGDTEVLVGNVPDLWRLPAYQACLPGAGSGDTACQLPFVPSERDVRATVEAYNEAIERVVEGEDAELVDLSGRGELTGLTAADGFHPSTEGHREVARAFAEALEG